MSLVAGSKSMQILSGVQMKLPHAGLFQLDLKGLGVRISQYKNPKHITGFLISPFIIKKSMGVETSL